MPITIPDDKYITPFSFIPFLKDRMSQNYKLFFSMLIFLVLTYIIATYFIPKDISNSDGDQSPGLTLQFVVGCLLVIGSGLAAIGYGWTWLDCLMGKG